MDNIKITIEYKGKTYTFDFGSEVYIFHTGIYNDMDKKYSKKTLLQYTALIQDCYLKDSNRTPLGAFADYVARNWKIVKNLDRTDILEKFYTEEF